MHEERESKCGQNEAKAGRGARGTSEREAGGELTTEPCSESREWCAFLAVKTKKTQEDIRPIFKLLDEANPGPVQGVFPAAPRGGGGRQRAA